MQAAAAITDYCVERLSDEGLSEEMQNMYLTMAAKAYIWLKFEPLVNVTHVGHCVLLTKSVLTSLVGRLDLLPNALMEVCTIE